VRHSSSQPFSSTDALLFSASPSTSPEEATNIQQQPVADYPRPRSANKDEIKPDAEAGLTGEGAASNEEGAKGGNRKERRRQERNKKDKYQTEEDKMHDSMQKSDLPFDVKSGGNKDTKSKRAPSATGGSGGGGPRITQPMGKFMA
jgi:hypothetical protein